MTYAQQQYVKIKARMFNTKFFKRIRHVSSNLKLGIKALTQPIDFVPADLIKGSEIA